MRIPPQLVISPARARRRGQSVLEFSLALPFLVGVMALFLGLGRTLVARQHGLVAARYAAFYQKLTDVAPPVDQLEHGVSLLAEPWQLNPADQDVSGEVLGSDSLEGDETTSIYVDFVRGFGSHGAVRALVVHHATEGLAARMLNQMDVNAIYTIPTKTFTSCSCGAFLAAVLDALPSFLQPDRGQGCL
jgi:hypothetical protein